MALNYRRYDLGASFRLNGASFYDLFGPKKTSRKGYSAGLDYTRSIIYDTPRSMSLKLGVTGYGNLEVLPENQNVRNNFV